MQLGRDLYFLELGMVGIELERGGGVGGTDKMTERQTDRVTCREVSLHKCLLTEVFWVLGRLQVWFKVFALPNLFNNLRNGL